MALLLELPLQALVVVDLSVADHPDGTVFVADRLAASVDVDNREPSVPEDSAVSQILSFIIRSR